MNKKNSFTNLLKQKDPDAVLYVIGIAVSAATALSYFLIMFLGKHSVFFSLLSQCVFRKITGFYCPGCGGTRAFICLIHGNIIQSLVYYPFVPYAVSVGLVFYISQTLRFITHGRVKGLHFCNFFITIGIILIAGNWIVKNLLLGIWGIEVMI